MTGSDVSASRRFRVDRSWTRPGSGTVALGGSPLRLFRLTEGGRRVVEALERGTPLPSGHEPLTSRLLEAGAIHPVVSPSAPPDPSVAAADVDVVVPVHDEDPAVLAALVDELSRSPRIDRIVVVDDGSSTPLPPIAGATVMRLETNLGPGGARNAGVRATAAPHVLFVDADIGFGDDPADRVVEMLRQHVTDDDRVALVAPRVRAEHGTGALAAFDAVRSPLDLGSEPARVRPVTRVSYVPAAAMLVRRDAFDRLGGFDPSMRFGEDVDLVWRFDDTDWRCRYEPAVSVRHRVRPTLRRWVAQRRGYGTSAAPLAARHGSDVAPVRIGRWSAAAWVAGAVVHPIAGLAVAGATTAVFARRLGAMPERTTIALRYAGLGHLHAGRLLARAMTRTWWPITLAAALVSRRARRLLVAAVTVPALAEWWSARPHLDPVRHVALSVADDVAYGTGVWIGCWRARDATALLPDLTA